MSIDNPYEELLPIIAKASTCKWGLALMVANEERTLLREQINQAKRDTEFHDLRVLTPRYPEDELWLVPRNENLLKLRSISMPTT